MTETQSYFVDIINMFPNEASCFIQTPGLDDSEILALMLPTQFEYFKEIMLTESNKVTLIEKVKSNNIEQYFQSIEIRCNNQLMFEGYDGMEYGTISKTFELPVWFIDKYINSDMCVVSEDW